MLITPTLRKSSNPTTLAIMNIISGGKDARVLRPGVIQLGHWNPEYEIREKILDKWPATENFDFPSYGVADNIDQVLALYDFEADPRKYFISVVEIRKDEQESDGGWRWHKWGEYIGTQNPCREYIYDEPEIESVITFHIYEVE